MIYIFNINSFWYVKNLKKKYKFKSQILKRVLFFEKKANFLCLKKIKRYFFFKNSNKLLIGIVNTFLNKEYNIKNDPISLMLFNVKKLQNNQTTPFELLANLKNQLKKISLKNSIILRKKFSILRNKRKFSNLFFLENFVFKLSLLGLKNNLYLLDLFSSSILCNLKKLKSNYFNIKKIKKIKKISSFMNKNFSDIKFMRINLKNIDFDFRKRTNKKHLFFLNKKNKKHLFLKKKTNSNLNYLNNKNLKISKTSVKYCNLSSTKNNIFFNNKISKTFLKKKSNFNVKLFYLFLLILKRKFFKIFEKLIFLFFKRFNNKSILSKKSFLFINIINKSFFEKDRLFSSSFLISKFILNSLKKGDNLKFLTRNLGYILNENIFILGYKIIFAGRFNRSQRALYNVVKFGRVPLNTIELPIDYNHVVFNSRFGCCGIKICLYTKGIFHAKKRKFIRNNLFSYKKKK